MFDIVIRGGTVVDGSGAPRYHADVGINDGVIAEISSDVGRGHQELDAEGHIIAPGFVDGHTHMDAQLFWEPQGTSSCWHGVTTVVTGNCGFTLAPAKAQERELVIRNLERAEDIAPDALAEGIAWSWETFPEFLDAVDQVPKGINYAAQIGHSAVRTWAMGERAFEQEATEDDLSEMARQVAAATEAGAVGFTTSQSTAHETSDDRPVASRLASWSEVAALVAVMGDHGGGVFQLALHPDGRDTDRSVRQGYRAGLVSLTDDPRVTVISGFGGGYELEHLAACAETARRGGGMYALSHSRGVSIVLSFKTRLPFDALPEWREVRALPVYQQAALFRDPDVRRRLVESAHHGRYPRATGAKARRPEYRELFVYDRALPPHRSVADIARERQIDPVELILDLAVESDLDVLFLQPLTSSDPELLLSVMKHPRAVMTFSDAGAHVSQIVDCSIQTHLLAYWTRERKAFSLEEAVHMITQVPASVWGLHDRGLLREGLAADINVFDSDEVAPQLPTVATDFPGATKRFKQRATGFRATLVGGEIVIREGEHTGALPGRLLRRTGRSGQA